MSNSDLEDLLEQKNVSPLRVTLARWIESRPVQVGIIVLIVLNSIILGLETSADIMSKFGGLLIAVDQICLAVFCFEIVTKLFCYRLRFWKSGWNIFDFFVVAIALVPGAGVWAVLRTLRILRVLRLLTVVPSLRKVVAAFIHSIPGLSSVMVVMMIFFYAAAVLANGLFGQTHPEWFGSLGASLYTLFQIMTLESWSMGIVRPVMESHPWAWMFFVPFIVVATFTILNLFIGIIVSTMQELSMTPEVSTSDDPEVSDLLERIDDDLRSLRARILRQD